MKVSPAATYGHLDEVEFRELIGTWAMRVIGFRVPRDRELFFPVDPYGQQLVWTQGAFIVVTQPRIILERVQ